MEDTKISKDSAPTPPEDAQEPKAPEQSPQKPPGSTPQEIKQKPEQREKHSEVIFVGSKPIMNYVTALVMQFTSKDAKEVKILSRGKFITKAVDIAEIVRNRFLEGKVTLGDIKIGSEHFQNAEGKKVSVSSIEITLKK